MPAVSRLPNHPSTFRACSTVLSVPVSPRFTDLNVVHIIHLPFLKAIGLSQFDKQGGHRIQNTESTDNDIQYEENRNSREELVGRPRDLIGPLLSSGQLLRKKTVTQLVIQ